MSNAAYRVRVGLLALAAILAVAVLGFHFGAGKDWIESLWLVVVTISTVGFGESSELAPGMQLFMIGLIVTGIAAASATFTGLAQLIVEDEILQAMGRRRMTREISQLRGHIIICGFGRIGKHLAEGLQEGGKSIIVIDDHPDTVAAARDEGHLCLQGDATLESTLKAAQVEQADYVMTTLPKDADNVFITLTSRNLNPTAEIITRAEQPSTEPKLRQAGADRVVMPTVVSAAQMVRMITHPSTADLMDLVSERTFLGVELDELEVSSKNSLSGISVAATEAHSRHGLLVVAVKKAAGKMIFNPDADYRFADGDVIIMLGNQRDIQKFREHFNAEP